MTTFLLIIMVEQPLQPKEDRPISTLPNGPLMGGAVELCKILGTDVQTIFAKLRQEGLLNQDYLQENPEFREAIENLASGRSKIERDIPQALNEHVRLIMQDVIEERKINEIKKRKHQILALLGLLFFLMGAGVTLLTVRTTTMALTEARKNCNEEIKQVIEGKNKCERDLDKLKK